MWKAITVLVVLGCASKASAYASLDGRECVVSARTNPAGFGVDRCPLQSEIQSVCYTKTAARYRYSDSAMDAYECTSIDGTYYSFNTLE